MDETEKKKVPMVASLIAVVLIGLLITLFIGIAVL